MCRCCISRDAILHGLAAAALLLACAALAAAPLDLNQALRTSQAAVGTTVAPYTLTRTDGVQVRLTDYRGKPLLVNFVYTGCSQVCPTAVRFLGMAMAQAHATLGADAFNAVTIGFNLPFDDPQAMRAFALQHGRPGDHWDFLSPAPAELPSMARDFGFSFQPTSGGFDHVTQVTIVDAQGRIVRQVYGESFDPQRLIVPLRGLVSGAPPPPEPALSALFERVRILCTVYDPVSGRYRIDYGLLIEVLAGLSVIGAVLFYLAAEWRRNRRLA